MIDIDMTFRPTEVVVLEPSRCSFSNAQFDAFYQPLLPLVNALQSTGAWTVLSDGVMWEGDLTTSDMMVPLTDVPGPTLSFSVNIVTAGVYHLSCAAKRPIGAGGGVRTLGTGLLMLSI